ncbi:hypothetical protein [Mediannikoviicoccus vaginalis]|uniref:hypothetical protein n=1 Tax=Mediannikoviicoccus vaginalis TaxID=2899727 RepID=UPI001F359029|nr:hypothetical protein [Mediannikoviicoccus vaginalis]
MLKILIILFMIVLVREIIETLRSKKIPFPLNKVLKRDRFYILYTATLTLILAVLLLVYFKGNLPTV